MTSTTSNQDTRAAVVKRLLARRAELQKTLDDALSSPQSYSIQGSYSQTSQSPDQLREEIARLDSAILALSGEGGPIRRTYPRYIAP